MTLSDVWPGFQGHYIFESRISEKQLLLYTNRKLPNIWNGTTFGDLD